MSIASVVLGRRVSTLVLVLGAGMATGWVAAAKSQQRSTESVQRSLSKSKPVAAVPAPASVQRALQKTQAARYVVLSESSQSGPVRYEVDNSHGRAVTFVDRKATLIEIGAEAYTPRQGSACFLAAKRPAALLPNIAGMLLPSGTAAIHYVLQGRTIGWSVSTAHGYQPHGMVTVDGAGRIVSATLHSGPGVPLIATAAYPTKPPSIAAPKRLCRAGVKSRGALSR